MLLAKKQELANSYAQRTIAIKSKELQYHVMSQRVLGSLASLFVCFAYSSLTAGTIYAHASHATCVSVMCADLLHPLGLSVLHSLSMYAAWSTNLNCMLAPCLLLHGDVATLSQCIDDLASETWTAARLVVAAAAVLLMCSVTWAWFTYEWPAAACATLVAATFAAYIHLRLRVLRSAMLPPSTHTSSFFRPHRSRDMM